MRTNIISQNRRNIYESNQINQTILEIDFLRTFLNEWGSSTFCKFGISKYYQYAYSKILSNVNNQGLQKLCLWNLMDARFGRFFNSNSPAKSLKLYSPIWMDSNDSQFNMWNDFDLSFPNQLFLWVNDLLPILRLFNRFNPSILNACTDLKLLSPISIDSTRENREKSNIV